MIVDCTDKIACIYFEPESFIVPLPPLPISLFDKKVYLYRPSIHRSPLMQRSPSWVPQTWPLLEVPLYFHLQSFTSKGAKQKINTKQLNSTSFT